MTDTPANSYAVENADIEHVYGEKTDGTFRRTHKAGIKNAISEKVSIALTNVDVTLTDTQQAAGYLNLTGTLTGNVNLLASATLAGKWLINNGTTGSYSVTFKPTGGSGVTITQGSRVEVYSDGATAVFSTVDNDTVLTTTNTKPVSNKTFSDSTTYIADNLDATKLGQFQLSGLTTGQTRTLTWPDASGTILHSGNIGSSVLAFYNYLNSVGGLSLAAGDLIYPTSASAAARLANPATASKFLKTLTANPYFSWDYVCDYTELTASGSWSTSVGVRFILIQILGAGGGGASGQAGTGSGARNGGGGGGGGGMFWGVYSITGSASMSGTIGAGGTGGAAPVYSTSAANSGSDGGYTSFALVDTGGSGSTPAAYYQYVHMSGGKGAVGANGGNGSGLFNRTAATPQGYEGSTGGSGSTAPNGAVYGGGGGAVAGFSGASASTDGGANSAYGGGGGGGGGSYTGTSTNIYIPTNGGARTSGGGTGGDTMNQNGGHGASAGTGTTTAAAAVAGVSADKLGYGGGGGGANGHTANNGAAGGNGGYGGGGGGGGASRAGNGGAGGNGGGAIIRVWAF